MAVSSTDPLQFPSCEVAVSNGLQLRLPRGDYISGEVRSCWPHPPRPAAHGCVRAAFRTHHGPRWAAAAAWQKRRSFYL